MKNIEIFKTYCIFHNIIIPYSSISHISTIFIERRELTKSYKTTNNIWRDFSEFNIHMLNGEIIKINTINHGMYNVRFEYDDDYPNYEKKVKKLHQSIKNFIIK